MKSMEEGAPRNALGRLLDWLEERVNLTEMFALLTSLGIFYAEVDTKKPVRTAVREALEKPMASYVQWPRVLGPLAVLMFFFEGATGVLLAFYYRSSVGEAHESVQILLRDVNFGWLIHQVHRWGAQLLVALLILRMVRFFFEGVYKKPRELLWVSGALLLIVATHADFTGRLLTWNQVSYWKTVRGLETLFVLPVVGPLFALLIGGRQVTAFTLSRFYFLHVAVLPAFLLFLLYMNFATVRRVGLTAVPSPVEAGSGRAQYRSYLYNLLILVVLILGGLVTLSVLLPVPFLPEADPFSTPGVMGPPWYLMAAHLFVEAFPAAVPDFVRGALLLACFALFILWPFVDRSESTHWRARLPLVAVGAAMVVVWLVLTVQGVIAEGVYTP